MEIFSLIENSFETAEDVKKQFVSFVTEHPTTFNSRDNVLGHVTCSMLVLNETMDSVLLTHHKKFGIWLQLGGHWDDTSESALMTALRETSEEGYGEQKIVCDVFFDGMPFDLDAHHVVDPKGNHTHFDICFASIVKKNFKVDVSHESHDVKWFKIDRLIDTPMANSRLNRLLHKSKEIIGNPVSFEVDLKSKNKLKCKG